MKKPAEILMNAINHLMDHNIDDGDSLAMRQLNKAYYRLVYPWSDLAS